VQLLACGACVLGTPFVLPVCYFDMNFETVFQLLDFGLISQESLNRLCWLGLICRNPCLLLHLRQTGQLLRCAAVIHIRSPFLLVSQQTIWLSVLCIRFPLSIQHFWAFRRPS
jgi:hypothetical protein